MKIKTRKNWEVVYEDRGMMTAVEEAELDLRYREIFSRENSYAVTGKFPQELPPLFGKPRLQFDRRKSSYLAFKCGDIYSLVSSLSSETVEIVEWGDSKKDHISISQPHDGVHFISGFGRVRDHANPFLKQLSSFVDVYRFHSMSNDDPCSFQFWKGGKAVRILEWAPHPITHGESIDLKIEPFEVEPFFDGERIHHWDVNKAQQEMGIAGHRIPPRKHKDEEVLAWRISYPHKLAYPND